MIRVDGGDPEYDQLKPDLIRDAVAEGAAEAVEELLVLRDVLHQPADVHAPPEESARLQQSYEAMLAAQQEVDRLYARWSELEAKQDC